MADASQGTQKSRHQPPPVLADRSVAPAPGWHPSPGCKWCCCSGRCSLLDFLSWLCYSCRCGSLGLHPVYAVRNVTCAPKPFSFTGDKRSVLRRAVIPAEQGAWQVACVTQSFQSSRCCCRIHSTRQHNRGPAAPPQRACETSLVTFSPDLRARVHNAGDPPQTTS